MLLVREWWLMLEGVSECRLTDASKKVETVGKIWQRGYWLGEWVSGMSKSSIGLWVNECYLSENGGWCWKVLVNAGWWWRMCELWRMVLYGVGWWRIFLNLLVNPVFLWVILKSKQVGDEQRFVLDERRWGRGWGRGWEGGGLLTSKEPFRMITKLILAEFTV